MQGAWRDAYVFESPSPGPQVPRSFGSKVQRAKGSLAVSCYDAHLFIAGSPVTAVWPEADGTPDR
jgi:hypothetical protein